MSNRVVFIGGFANGKEMGQEVSKALEYYYAEVEDPWTFARAMDDSRNSRLESLIKGGVNIVTHSAGMMAVDTVVDRDLRPESVHAIAAPVPTSIPHLLGRSAQKTWDMHVDGYDPRAVLSYNMSSTAEVLAHPIGNFRHLGAISRYDSVEFGKDLVAAGIPTGLTVMNRDQFFQISVDREREARTLGIDFQHAPGVHDELVLYPGQMLADIDVRPRLG